MEKLPIGTTVKVHCKDLPGLKKAVISGHGYDAYDYSVKDVDNGETYYLYAGEVVFTEETPEEKVAKAKELLEEAGYEIDHIDGGFTAWETPVD